MQSKIDLFSQLLRDLEAEIGTRDVNDLTLRALEKSIKYLKARDVEDFCKQFENLLNIISQTEPKFGILIYNFESLNKYFKDNVCSKEFNEKKWKRVALHGVKNILKTARGQKASLIKNSEKLNLEGKTILIHDHSHTVQDVIVHNKRMGKHFKVVIAEQDYDKTHGNIERLHKAGISFQVVPSYMLSHIHKNIDILSFGALTLKDTMDFVMDPGTHSIISEFHVENIPSYMFIDTSKFSLWKSKKRSEIFIHKHLRQHHSKPIEYERIKYSHDRVPVKLFKKIITDEGVLNPGQLKDLFEKRHAALTKKNSS